MSFFTSPTPCVTTTMKSSSSWWWWMLAMPTTVDTCPSFIQLCDIAFVLLVFALVVATVTWLTPCGPAWWRHQAKNTLRGPRGFPVLGNLLDMKGLAHRRLAVMAERWGCKDIMAFSVGLTPTVICTSPFTAREVLNSPAFADRPPRESAKELMFDRAMGFAPSGEYYKKLRHLAASHLFSPPRVAMSEPLRSSIATRMLSEVSQATTEVRVRDVLHRASLNNMMGCLFGRTYEVGCKESEELGDMVKEGYELISMFNWADHFPLLSFLDLQGVKGRCRALVPRIHGFIQNIMEQHKSNVDQSLKDCVGGDFVDVLLSLNGKERLDKKDIVSLLWEMVFRGTDTVAFLLEWILARIIQHQDIQAKIHQEMDSLMEGCKERPLMESDICKLKYMQAVVKEVLRMHPPGPLLSWARLAIHDVDVGGHHIPCGTAAMVNMWAITHDESIWEKPNEFKPERFLQEDVNVMGNDLRLAPFGSGKRVCPGKALALQTVHAWLARMLYHYKWLPSPHHPVDFAELLKLSCEMKYPLYGVPMRRNNAPFQ